MLFPLVTIYIPTFNRVALLQRAVSSVLNQTYRNIELIVVDDGSNDSTIDYLSSAVKLDSRMRYFVNDFNSGACVSRNKAIMNAKGEFITGLDDDDYFFSDRISCFVNSWAGDPGIIALYSDVVILGDNYSKVTSNPVNIKCSNLIHRNYIGNQIFLRTAEFQNIGGFDPNFRAWQDLDCWYRLLSKNKAVIKKVSKATYVLDQSHPHERISTGRISKFEETYCQFVEKHKLSKIQQTSLKVQLFAYKPSVNLSEIIKFFLGGVNLMALARLIRLYLSRR